MICRNVRQLDLSPISQIIRSDKPLGRRGRIRRSFQPRGRQKPAWNWMAKSWLVVPSPSLRVRL